jgi:tagatose 6-phosphate kinase
VATSSTAAAIANYAEQQMILCIGTTPAAQRVMIFQQLRLGEVNRALRTLDGAAGKSVNVSKVLCVLGAKAVATGFFGGRRGDQLRELLSRQGLDIEFVEVSTPTRECVTVIDQSNQMVTELVEESQPVPGEAYDQLLAIVQRRVPGCRAVVMSGTIASGGPTDLYARCTRLAHAAGALAIIDGSRAALLAALDDKPDMVKPNRAELEATVQRELRDEAAVISAMRELQAKGARRVIVTAGAQPCLAHDGSSLWRITAPVLQAVNPIGSGDAFTAAAVWRLTLGEDLGAACGWGSATGAANALTEMAGEVRRRDVERLLPAVRVERL